MPILFSLPIPILIYRDFDTSFEDSIPDLAQSHPRTSLLVSLFLLSDGET